METPTKSPETRSRPAWSSARLDQKIVEVLVSGDDEAVGELADSGIGDARMRARGRELGVTSDFIKQCRLSESRPGIRSCMRCDREFLSIGIQNRLCQVCGRR